MEAAGRAEKELGAEIKVIKKTSAEYQKEKDPLPCPSVVVNGRIIAGMISSPSGIEDRNHERERIIRRSNV